MQYPEHCKVVDDPVLNSWGIRFIIVKNYLAFFIIDEEKKEVNIVRFLFQKSFKPSLYNDLKLITS